MLALALWIVLDVAPISATPTAPASAAATPPVRAVAPASSLGARLVASVGSPADYRALRRAVLAWHHTTRNACAAFVATALGRVGAPIPADLRVDGLNPSRITLGLATYLVDHGWRRVDDPARLAPGDLVFTVDDPCCPGFPEHVFLFAGWHGRPDRGQALAIDNQGFRRVRPVAGDARYGAFQYALRAP